MKRLLIQIGLGLLLVLAGAAAGRYFAPAKVVTETKIEYQDRIVEKEVVKVQTVYVEKKAEAKNVYTKKTETIRPDGVKTIVEETKDTSKSLTETGSAVALAASRDVEAQSQVVQHSRQETTQERPRNTLVLMGGINTKLQPNYGLAYTRNLIGPLGVGLYYQQGSDYRIGAAISLSF